MTGGFDGRDARAELDEMEADFPSVRISRKRADQHVRCIARPIGAGATPGAVEAASPAQLRVMLEPPALDARRPNIARVWDCLLGGCFL